MPAQVLGGEQKQVTFPSMRFFFLLQPPPTDSGSWKAPAELMQHLRALRFAADEEFLLVFEGSQAWRARCLDRTQIELLGSSQTPSVKLHSITLATAWPKGKRAEDLVMRACEAGVAKIQPVEFQRSVAGRQAWGNKQQQRLMRIARECCQQLRNPDLPELATEPLPFAAWLADADPAVTYYLHPGAKPLAEQLSGPLPAETVLVIGPEGGFADEEIGAMEHAGLKAAGISPLILRIEAAGPAAAMLIQHRATF